jgi:flagella basal body P-ring formation protein FlgA
VAARAETVPVPRIAIYPGDVIGDDMLVDRAVPPQTDVEARVFLGREGLVGKVARLTLVPGQPIPANGVREPFVIKQGQPALVVFAAGALVISTTAVPLQPGAIGDTISLRNSDSGSTIRGIVQADGTVRVGLP